MALLQHYYTSTTTGTTGGAGFQCKAMSPGISAEEIKALNNLLGYRIPPTLMDRNVTEHPIALRYELLNPNKCILLCSQSNGNDENGRPGNFFAHSVIMSPKDFDVFPPIMFYKHPFWKTHDDSSILEIPPQESFNLDPSLDFQDTWTFLDNDHRRHWFKLLLNAVISYEKSKRPIVILDTTDNIAKWILAVSVSLPRIFRWYITFATYHHDPYQAPFLITGTSPDSKFRFSSDEYISYFVLNAQDDRISDIEESEYVKFIAENFQPDLYDSKILDFFQLCDHRLRPSPREMGLKLDLMTRFYFTVREKKDLLTEENARESVRTFISGFDSQREIIEEDIDDLKSTEVILRKQIQRSPDIRLVQDFSQTLHLLKKHYQKISNSVQDHMALLANVILQDNEQVAWKLTELYQEVYGSELLKDVAGRPEYLKGISEFSPSNNWHVQYLIWKLLMQFVEVNAKNKVYLSRLYQNALRSVSSLPATDSDFPSKEAQNVLEAMIHSMENYQRFLLEADAGFTRDQLGIAYSWLYYELVSALDLEKRVPYRKLAKAYIPDVLEFEARCDIKRYDKAQIIKAIQIWLEHTAATPDQLSLVLSSCVTALPMKFSEKDYHDIIGEILEDHQISKNLTLQDEQRLLETYFSSPRFIQLNDVEKQVLFRYHDRSYLTPQQKALIGGSIAMSTGKFLEKSVPSIRAYLAQQDENGYKLEAGKLINESFARDFEIEMHMQVLQCTYDAQHSTVFWELYWQNFIELMLSPARSHDFVKLLAFWIEESVPILGETPYLIQSFFLELPEVVDQARKTKGFERSFRQISAMVSNKPWYILVAHFFSPKEKRGILGVFTR